MSRKNTRGAFGKAKNRPAPVLPEAPIKFEPLQDPIELPESVKGDIAKVVRSLQWESRAQDEHGYCFYRAMSGLTVLTMLGIPATLVRGGMVYRAGPDPQRDAVAYCGPGDRVLVTKERFYGHWWLVSGSELIDFTPGDWQADAARLFQTAPPEERALGPIQWTASALPDFFWDNQSKYHRCSVGTPPLGEAAYIPDLSEFDFNTALSEFRSSHSAARTVHTLSHGIELYALRARIFAEREGHTAITLAQLARIANDPAALAQAQHENQLFVLRGKPEITPEKARELLAERNK